MIWQIEYRSGPRNAGPRTATITRLPSVDGLAQGWKICYVKPWGGSKFTEHSWAKTKAQAKSLARKWCRKKR